MINGYVKDGKYSFSLEFGNANHIVFRITDMITKKHFQMKSLKYLIQKGEIIDIDTLLQILHDLLIVDGEKLEFHIKGRKKKGEDYLIVKMKELKTFFILHQVQGDDWKPVTSSPLVTYQGSEKSGDTFDIVNESFHTPIGKGKHHEDRKKSPSVQNSRSASMDNLPNSSTRSENNLEYKFQILSEKVGILEDRQRRTEEENRALRNLVSTLQANVLTLMNASAKPTYSKLNESLLLSPISGSSHNLTSPINFNASENWWDSQIKNSNSLLKDIEKKMKLHDDEALNHRDRSISPPKSPQSKTVTKSPTYFPNDYQNIENSTLYPYRVHLSEWDPNYSGPSIEISTNKRRITQKYFNYATAFVNLKLHAGRHQWTIRINHSQSSWMFIGVSKPSFDRNGICGFDSDSWSIQAFNGRICHDKIPRPYYNKKLQAGDEIKCCLDLSKREIRFIINGFDSGVAFSNLTGPLVPCVTLGYEGDSCSILPDEMDNDSIITS